MHALRVGVRGRVGVRVGVGVRVTVTVTVRVTVRVRVSSDAHCILHLRPSHCIYTASTLPP